MKLPKVKICGITRVEDAETALAEGADFLGFIFYDKSPRNITLGHAQSLFSDAEIPEEKRVVVAVNPNRDTLSRWRDGGFSHFQIHFPMDLPGDRVLSWGDAVGLDNLWLAPRTSSGQSLPEELLPLAETFLVDACSEDTYGGTGKTADWERFAEWKTNHPDKTWILAGGLSPENVRQAVAATHAEIVDANSGVEATPGIKDPLKIRAFFDRLRAT
ncbi:MAG: phosphoribosylanthranilate isomerase [Opitutales bacterium]